MMHSSKAQKLVYFQAERDSLVIITFIGSFNASSALVLESCMKDCESLSGRKVVLNFRDVSEHIEKAPLPTLGRLLKALRERQAQLKISGAHPALKQRLLENQTCAPSEFFNNLSEALREETVEDLIHAA